MDLAKKKVLVTGADGFIGSHLAEMLVQKGAKVRALVQYNSFNSWGWLDNSPFAKEMEIIAGDVRDPELCMRITEDMHSVFHLAALIGIPYSYSAPQSYVETNVGGTLNMCLAARRHSTEKLLVTSTSEVYGTAKSVPMSEDHPFHAQSPYSASKIGADAIAMSFYHSFELPVVLARPFNTYGPRQSARAIIPTLISQIAAGKSEIFVGDTTPTRDFTYVSDTCSALCELVLCDKSVGQVVNIGSNYEVSIQKLFGVITDLMASSAKLQTDPNRLRPKGSEVFRLWCDNTKLDKLTGFKPSVELSAGLKNTIQWFSDAENLKKYKLGTYNV